MFVFFVSLCWNEFDYLGSNIIKKWLMILFVVVLLTGIFLTIAIFTGNTSILNRKKAALVKAIVKYQNSRWDYKELYDIVNSSEVKSINISSILDEESVDEIDNATDAIIKIYEERVKLIDGEGENILNEDKAILRIERAIGKEIDSRHRAYVDAIVIEAMSFTELEKELLDLYVDFYSSKIILAKNTKDLAIQNISVGDYNEFEKKRKDFLKTVSLEEKRIVNEMINMDIEIDDTIYRLLLALEQ